MNNSTLTTLNLSSNEIGIEGGKANGEALVNNSTLTTLDLRYNKIGDVGGKAIGEALAKNSTLTTLIYAGTLLALRESRRSLSFASGIGNLLLGSQDLRQLLL